MWLCKIQYLILFLRYITFFVQSTYMMVKEKYYIHIFLISTYNFFQSSLLMDDTSLQKDIGFPVWVVDCRNPNVPKIEMIVETLRKIPEIKESLCKYFAHHKELLYYIYYNLIYDSEVIQQ